MLLIIGLAVVVIIVAVLGVAAMRPNDFRYQRSTSIAAPPERIAPHINDFHAWQAWSPYEGRDPAMTRSFGGQPAGKGATYAWAGNNKVGTGSMEILDAATPNRVLVQLDFERPFKANNTAEFLLTPRGNTTDVTWAMYGATPFVSKVMGLFMNMDRMVGRDFEVGLANLKRVCEG